ncbi:MAG: hypothetical protein HUU16_09735 [Candidatus Omnitrophica bacterium]|nr:hypothetical protein [bacterium]NUN96443.1 hypothetical protein [Candidatus Omnitrophota bacterium]
MNPTAQWPSAAIPLMYALSLVFGLSPAQGGDLNWSDEVILEASTFLITAFNNAQPMIRSRDEQSVFVGYETDSGLHAAVIENATLVHSQAIASLPNAGGLTFEDSPDGTLYAAYSSPAGVHVRASTDAGRSFGPEVTIPNAGSPASSPSMSFAADGVGYLTWFSGASGATSVRYSVRDPNAETWSAGVDCDPGYTQSAFPCVWARGAWPLFAWRTDFDSSASEKWVIRFAELNGPTLNVSSLTSSTSSAFDPSVCRTADGTVLVGFFLGGGEIRFLRRRPGEAAFDPPQPLGDYGRFPRVVPNNRGMVGVSYEYSAVPGGPQQDEIKEVGFALSEGNGASYTLRAIPVDMQGIHYQTFSHVWLSDHFVDLIWIDGRTPGIRALKWRSAQIPSESHVSNWRLY